MSTVVLTLVVVGGSIAVATGFALSGELKPATEAPSPHRGARRSPPKRARRDGAAPPPVTVDQVPARPRLLVRLRALIALTALIAVIGAGIAVLLVAGVTVASRALETAVK